MKITPATIRNLRCIAEGNATKREMMRAMVLGAKAVEHAITIAKREGLICDDTSGETLRYALTDVGQAVLEGGPDAKVEIIRRCLNCGLWMKAETRTQRLCTCCGGYGKRLDPSGQRRQDRREAKTERAA